MLGLSGILLLLFYFPFAAGSYLSPSKSLSYTLGQNTILNSNISQPQIAPLEYFLYLSSINGWSTTRLFVEYIYITLHTARHFCPNFKNMPAGIQFLDTDSYMSNEEYYQEFVSTAGTEFRLTFDWISQLYSNKQSLGIAVIWNGVTIDYFYDCSCKLNTATYYLIAIKGTNQIKLAGIGTIDSNGILIRNINLQELLYVVPTPPPLPPSPQPANPNPQPSPKPAITQPINFWNLSNIVADSRFSQVFAIFSYLRELPVIGWSQRIPSLKQCLTFLFGHVLELNHLLLYNYHRRKFTLTASIYFAGMQALDDQRAYTINTYIFPIFGTSAKALTATFQDHTNLGASIKSVYPTYEQRLNSAILEILNLFLYQAPCTLICYIIGAIMFRFTFRYQISLLFRSFSIISFFLYTSIDGRIQIITFYCLSRLIILGSPSFKQKIGSVLIVMAYYVVFLFVISSFLLYKATNNRKLIKYIGLNCKFTNKQALHMNLNFGIYNILLGFTHGFLLNMPLIQLYTLISLEGSYLIYLTIFLIRKRIQNCIFGVILYSMNACRLLLILTHLTYHLNPQFETEIGQVQKYLFYSMGACWALSALACFIEKARLTLRIIKNPAKTTESTSPNRAIVLAEDIKNNPNLIKAEPKKTIHRTAQENIFTSIHELVAKGKQQAQ